MGNYSQLRNYHYYLLGFLLAGFFASALAVAPVKSFAKLLPFLIGGILFYKLTTNSWNNERLLTILKILLGGVFIMSLIGDIQYVLLLMKGVSGLSLRVTSITTHPNALAKFVVPFIPIALTLAVISLKTREKLIYGIVTVSLVVVELFTISRGAWISMAFSALLLMMLFRSFKASVCVTILAVISAVLLPSHIGLERVYSIFSLTHQWNFERVNVWHASLSMIKDHPLFGLGLNNFQYYYLAYKPEHGVEIFQHAHNTFLNIAVETGIIGLIFFSLFTFSTLYQIYFGLKVNDAYSYIRKSIGIGLLSLLVFGMVEYNFNNEAQIVLFFVMMAIGIKLGTCAETKISF